MPKCMQLQPTDIAIKRDRTCQVCYYTNIRARRIIGMFNLGDVVNDIMDPSDNCYERGTIGNVR